MLEVSPNATSSTALDLLTMGTKGDGVSQQGQALLSGFLNATPSAFTSLNVPEFDASVQTAAASPQAKPTNSPPFDFVIQPGYSDACYPDYPTFPSSSICANASLAEVVIVLTQGKFDNSSGNSFNVVYQCGGATCSISPVLSGPPEISHGNNGNEACQSLGPTTWCLDLKFVPGAITVAGFRSENLDFTIGTKPTDPSQLAGNRVLLLGEFSGRPLL